MRLQPASLIDAAVLLGGGLGAGLGAVLVLGARRVRRPAGRPPVVGARTWR